MTGSRAGRWALRGKLAARVLLGAVLALCVRAAAADATWVTPGPEGQPQVQLYFFWSQRCPHCADAYPHVAAIPAARPWVTVQAFELSQSPENARRFHDLIQRTSAPQRAAVPAFLFCGEMQVGWLDDATSGAELRRRLDACHARVLAGQAVVPPPPVSPVGEQIVIPFAGSVDAATWSLPVLTLVLAGLDAFNPCAFFVLLFLLSMLAQQRNRARMLTVGAVFVAMSGLLYFAFMAAWLNVFQLFGHVGWITRAAGALALGVGVVNVKDFFWFHRGPTLSIPASKQPDLFRRMRVLRAAERWPALLAATLLLAVAANSYELLCTAGFPMVYTHVLTLQHLAPAARYAWLAAYNLIYVLPLAVIVGVVATTLGAHKLSERGGRLLKLLSGAMMAELGIVLLIFPELVSKPAATMGLLALAVLVTAFAARRM